MNWGSVLKIALPLLIKAMGALIPALGSVLGIPIIGWLATYLISKLTDKLVDMVEIAIRDGAIDRKWRESAQELKQATNELINAINREEPDVHEIDEARERFRNRARDLIKLKRVQ